MWMQLDQQRDREYRRLAMLCAYGAFQGLSLAPLINTLLYIDPAIIATALIGTITVFICFSLSALVAKRSSYLYLGGLLSSGLTLMFFIGIANMFFRSLYLYNVQLYAGLMLFSGFVIFDTQLIIEVIHTHYLD